MHPTLPTASASTSGNFAPGTLVGGRYVVVRLLGAGSMGAVYEVSDAAIPERRLAFKILHEPARSAAAHELQRDELRSMVRVRHPSIIALYDHGEHEGRLFSVLPLMRGENLDGRVFGRKEVHRIGVTLAQALAAMHEVGLTHQDIKPENAQLTHFDGVPEPVPILLDLGTAVRVGTPLRGFSPMFLAPEVARAVVNGQTPNADTKADVYGLAITLHALLEARVDEDVENLTVYLAQRAEQAPPRFRTRSLRFLDVYFARWAATDPEQRPSAAELAKELDALLLPERRRTRRIRLAVAFGILCCIGMVAAYYVRRANLATATERQHVVAVEQQRRAAETRAATAQSQLGTTRNALDSASNRVDVLTSNAETLAAEAQKERDQAESWETRAGRLSKTVAALRVVITDLHAAVTEERALRDRLAAQVQQRESELATASTLQRETAAARDRAASEASRISAQLDIVQGALDRTQADLVRERDSAQRERASMSQAAETARARIADLSSQLTEVERLLDVCRARPVPSPVPAPTPAPAPEAPSN